MSSFRYNPSATLISLRPMSSKMCNPCPRTTVTHVSGLYTAQEGRRGDGRKEGTREAWIEIDDRPVTGVYAATRLLEHGLYYVVTVLRRVR